ncbi:insulinase family protein [Thalassomonas viridans]|uniref:Insulinase family protein n=1 Tax=Thalassomonas viridans TaxID=137584 RepID=A0AAE9Z3N5_9GAMM|nr:pitrilysin family protein [Thalassomonas viridans]WDE05973.1 insulinase family protein [Thalassomonas viridans]
MNNKFQLSAKTLLLSAALSAALAGCSNQQTEQNPTTPVAAEVAAGGISKQTSAFDLQYEAFELENGLKVILHQDKSDPIVAMSTIVHVGSSREKAGRTGFAHFFEHMSFNDSENVPKGANRKMIPELGGSRNGGTWSDGTIYYEVVPKDAFDKLLWIDSDRLGFMLNTVDAGTLEREKQVVKNEKRQRVDNRPYGHTYHVIKKALYPEHHPYNWTVIGDLADLQAATLEDVKEFYHQFYVPSNATLVIAGDIDISETKKKVNLWFGEIKAGKPVPKMQPQPVTLAADKKLYHLDNFAKLPEIRLTFPAVEQYHKDAYALEVLAILLSEGKNAALYKSVVEKARLAPGVSAWNQASEIAGTFSINVRGNKGARLDDVYRAIEQALADFEKNSFSQAQLDKIKAKQETDFYYAFESILDKAQKLGEYNEYAGSPEFIKTDIANITSVTKADVMRVYRKYIKDKAAIITSFVPKDQPELIVTGSVKANVEEEVVKQGAEQNFVENDAIVFEKTPTKFDRSEPPLSELPELKIPDVWQAQQGNGLRVYGIEQTELPIVNFSLRVDGGQLLDSKDKLGTAALMAQLMNEGTQSKTPLELEQAIGLLGAKLEVSGDQEGITIQGQTLAKNFEQTVALMKEILLAPRWDQQEFERLKAARLTRIVQDQGNASRIARNAFMKRLYPQGHIAATPTGGTRETVSAIRLDDIKDYYRENISPKQASLHVVGAVSQARVLDAIKGFNTWSGKAATLPQQPEVSALKQPQLYFIDLPGAKQSVIYVGKATVAAGSEDFYPVEVANNRLGSGMSARLGQTLRIQKGYTYGAYSYISPTSYQSPFIAASQVRTNVTLESLEIFKDLIANYRDTYKADDLAVTKNIIIKGNSRKFETLDRLLAMLETQSRFGLADDYIEQQQSYVKQAGLEQVHQTISKHLDEQQMIYLVVGDAKTQLKRMKDLGYGEPVMLDKQGNLI